MPTIKAATAASDDQEQSSDAMTRRDALRIGGAGAIGAALSSLFGAGCQKNDVTKEQAAQNAEAAYQSMIASRDPQNIINKLGGHKFRMFTPEGAKVIEIRDLARDIAGKSTSVSFGYCRCNEYCPTINGLLGGLGQKNQNLNSIIISATPSVDGEDKASHEDYKAYLVKSGMRADQAIVLYPLDANGGLSEEQSQVLQKKFGAIVNPDAKIHTTNVTLFAPDGTQLRNAKIAKEQGARMLDQISKDWEDAIATGGRKR